QHADEPETAATYLAEEAVRDALVGNASVAKERAQAAAKLFAGHDVVSIAGLALALAGDTAQASRMAGDLNQRYSQDTVIQVIFLPMIHGAIALHEGKPSAGLDVLAVTLPYDLGQPAQSVNFNMYQGYLRGLAYLAAHKGTEAAAEFQK